MISISIKANNQEILVSKGYENDYDFFVSIICGYWRHDYTVTYTKKSGETGSLYFGGPGVIPEEGMTVNVSWKKEDNNHDIDDACITAIILQRLKSIAFR